MANSSTNISLRFRWSAIAWGLVTFIWLPFEDTTTTFLLILSAGWCLWITAWLINKNTPQTKTVIRIITGGFGGALISPTALTLTLLKSGLHDHGFLDFSNTQLISIARSTPIWVFIGMLGSAAYIFHRSRKTVSRE